MTCLTPTYSSARAIPVSHDLSPPVAGRLSVMIKSEATLIHANHRSCSNGIRIPPNLDKGRWFIIAVCIVVNIASTAGAGNWSVYSQKLKTVLTIDQTTLNTIAAFNDLGVSFGVVAGLLYDYWSPRGVLILGALESVVGYLFAWLAVTRRIPPSVWQMCLFLFLGTNSESMVTVVVLVQSVKLFPESKGVTISLLKGYLGISAAVLIQVYQAIEGSKNPEAFLKLMMWLPASVALLSVPVISRTLKPFRGLPDLKYFYWFLAVGFGLAFYLMAVRVAQNLTNVSLVGQRIFGVVLLILLVIPLLVITYGAEIHGKRSADEDSASGGYGHGDDLEEYDLETASGNLEGKEISSHGEGESEPQFANEKLDVSDASERAHPVVAQAIAVEKLPVGDDDDVGKKVNWPRRGEDHTILQAFRTLDYWLLFVSGFGTGAVATNNMGQLGLSLGYSTTQVNTFVSLLSIWNAIGRWVGGFLSEFLVHRYAFPRTQFRTVVILLMSLAFLLIAVNVPGCLYFGSILLGLSIGAGMCLTPVIIAEEFGLKYFASLQSVWGITPIAGFYMLNILVAGRFYDDDAKRQLAAGSRNNATGSLVMGHGPSCYRRTFFILMGVNLAAALFNAILGYRTRDLYKEIQMRYQQVKIKSAKFKLASGQPSIHDDDVQVIEKSLQFHTKHATF